MDSSNNSQIRHYRLRSDSRSSERNAHSDTSPKQGFTTKMSSAHSMPALNEINAPEPQLDSATQTEHLIFPQENSDAHTENLNPPIEHLVTINRLHQLIDYVPSNEADGATVRGEMHALVERLSFDLSQNMLVSDISQKPFR